MNTMANASLASVAQEVVPLKGKPLHYVSYCCIFGGTGTSLDVYLLGKVDQLCLSSSDWARVANIAEINRRPDLKELAPKKMMAQ